MRKLDQAVVDRLGPDDKLESAIANYELAFRMQTAVPDLMNFGNETKATKALYGVSEPNTDIFGRQCLIARRLVERGVRFIELLCPHVGHDRWDQHTNLKKGHEDNALAVDKPIAGLLKDGGRLMGFGHRVFRIRDPRADMLRSAVASLNKDAGRLAFASEVERAALAALARHKPRRSLQSNIEMNAALLLDAVGVPRDGFTQVFAIARSPGWLANALEQQKTGRMIRPASNYVGPKPAE